MKFFFCFLVIISGASIGYAQLPPHLEGKIKYPVLNQNPFMGTLEVPANSLSYDPSITYKVVIDIYDKISDSTKLSFAFIDAARTYNLNIANGVPKEKLKMAIVVHGGASDALLNEESFQEKFGMANPNMDLIRAFKELGVPIYVCGQSLGFNNVPFKNIIPEVEIVLSAKTAFITFDQKGYTYLNVNED